MIMQSPQSVPGVAKGKGKPKGITMKGKKVLPKVKAKAGFYLPGSKKLPGTPQDKQMTKGLTDWWTPKGMERRLQGGLRTTPEVVVRGQPPKTTD